MVSLSVERISALTVANGIGRTFYITYACISYQIEVLGLRQGKLKVLERAVSEHRCRRSRER